MKILIVEDNEERIAWFKKEFEQYELDFATNANDAICKVAQIEFDMLMLDHDLEYGPLPCGFMPSEMDNTGYRVAQAIALSKNKEKPILIHSMNPVGAANICRVLPQAVRMPFSTFGKSIIIRSK